MLTYITWTCLSACTVSHSCVFASSSIQGRFREMICLISFFVRLGYARKPTLTKKTHTFWFVPISNSLYSVLLLVILAVAVPSVWLRMRDASRPHALLPVDTKVNAILWPMQFGFDVDGRTNVAAATEIIRNSNANLLGFVESDTSRPFMRNNDYVEFFERELHWYR
jgi:hypothetical protein